MLDIKDLWDMDVGLEMTSVDQIDHFLISSKWRRSLQDVRVKRGVDVGSDHHRVVAQIKLKVKTTGTCLLAGERGQVTSEENLHAMRTKLRIRDE